MEEGEEKAGQPARGRVESLAVLLALLTTSTATATAAVQGRFINTTGTGGEERIGVEEEKAVGGRRAEEHRSKENMEWEKG